MPYLSNEEADKFFDVTYSQNANGEKKAQELQEFAEGLENESISDPGELPQINWEPDPDAVGNALPVAKVWEIYENNRSAAEVQADYELETLPTTLKALRNSLNVDALEMKSLAEQSGLSYFAIDSDPDFARKKIDSDRYNEVMRGFMDNIDQTPHTAQVLRDLDFVEQLIMTSDFALSLANKEWRNQDRGFLETGYIGSAINAWEYGQFSREVTDLAQKLMNDTATDEDWRRLARMREVQSYGAGLREKQGLLERMVRGSVESVLNPLVGGIRNAIDWVGRYGLQGAAAGAAVGAALGSTAMGVGAIPGAVAGAARGLGAVGLSGFVEDMARQEGTNVYLTLRMDMGVPNDIARTLAYASGAAIGALEFTGYGMLARVFPGASKFLTKEAISAALGLARQNPAIQKAIGSTAMRMLQGAAGEVATEVSQEAVAIGAESIGRNWATKFSQEPTWKEIRSRLYDTAEQTLESVVIPVGIGGAVSSRFRRSSANPAQEIHDQEQNLLDQYAHTAQESRTVQALPETARKFLEAFAQEGAAPEHVYVSPQAIQETFFQEENADLIAVASEMGITPESLQENLALGTDVAIPFAKAAIGIFANQERYAALRDEMRLSPESPTNEQVQDIADIEQDETARQAFLDSLLEPLYQRQQADQSVQETRAEIAKPYMEQLIQAGWNEKQAYQYGQVLAANAEQMAQVYGITPQEYLQQRFAGYRKMTQADFEAGNIGFFQEEERDYVRDDFTRKDDEATAKVVALPDGVVPQTTVNDFAKWAINLLSEQGGSVVINSTGQNVQFSNNNVKASTKRSSLKRQGAAEHRSAYLALREMVANSEYWKSRYPNERHTDKGGQDLYTSALNMNGKLYSVILAFDKNTEEMVESAEAHNIDIGDIRYKDHKLAEIIIAPALYQSSSSTENVGLQHEADKSTSTEAITEVSLGILRGAVKPTKIENNVLHQNESGTVARGAMATLQDGRHFVAMFERQNASTILHETAHFFLEELRNANALLTAPAWVHETWQKLENAYGFSEWDIDRQGWVNVQERFAREFEAYCREGKAPSPELQTAFSRFRKWLTGIYKSIRSILGDNPVNEDVRQVFDRLLATEEEIAESRRAMEGKSALNNISDASKSLMERYQKAIERARKNVDAAFANRKLVERRQAENEIREQASKDIDASQTYQEIEAIREQGIPLEALKQVIDKDLVNYLRSKWRGQKGTGKELIRKGGGIDLMEAATRLGYDNVQALAYGLGRLSTRKEAIEELVNQRLAEWDASYDVEVEYSAAYDEALSIELEALTGQRQLTPNQLLQIMERRAGVKPVSELNAEYRELKARLRAEERLARKAYNEGSNNATAEWRKKYAELRQKERVRRAALQAAYRAKIESAKIMESLRKTFASKNIPYDYKQQIRAIMVHWEGLANARAALSREELNGMPSIDTFLEQQKLTPFGEPITAPQWLLDSLKNNRGKTGERFTNLSLEQMRDVQNLVRELAQAGKNQGKMLAAGRKIEIQTVADFCAAQIENLSERHYISERDNFIARNIGKLREYLSDTTAIRFLARALDGFQNHGINHDSWFNPLQQAQSKELAMRRQIYDKIRTAIMPLMANSSQLIKAFAIEDVALPEDVSREWGGLWDMDKVISVALNMGNEGNINALMGGYQFSYQDLQKITSRLTEEQWQAVQNIWDAIDTLYPELNAIYEKLKGSPLPKVKSNAFTVVTAEGKTLRLKGGYYPLMFDQRFSTEAAEQQSVDEMLNGMENIVRSPNPQSGMTQTRKGGKLPPKLSMSVLDRHITDTIHYITHALPLRDANSLFNNKTFKDAFIRHAGLENYNKLLPWLRGLARPDGERMASPVRALQYLANRGAHFALGGSFRTALLQLTSIGNSITEVGAANFFAASAKLLLSPVETYTSIRQKSAYMQARSNLFDDTMRRDYEEMQARGFGGVRFKGFRYSLDTLRHAQMGLMIAMDAAVASPTWLAAYETAIKTGLSEEEAVARADGAVVAAQSGGGVLDTPYVMRQSTWLRVICPFMSFAMGDFNRKLYHVRGIAEWAKTGNSAITPAVFLKHFALEWALPVFLTCMLTSLGRDGDLPEMQDYFWEALCFYTMGIPIARDVATMAKDNLSSTPRVGTRSPLIYSGIENLVKGAGHTWKAWDEHDSDAEYKALKEMVNAVGFATGLGTPQIFRTWEGSEAMLEGKGGVLSPLLGKPRK